MSISRDGIDINIRTRYDGTGVEQATTGIKGLEKPMEQASDATEKFTTKKKLLKEALKQVGHSIPEVSQLLLFLKNPLTIAAGAVAVLVASFKSYLDKLDEMEASLEIHERVGNAMSALGGAAADAARELGEFNTELGEVGDKGDTAAEKINKVIAAIQKLDEMQAEKRSAQEGLELAGVNEDERSGRISKGDAIRSRAAIKEKYVKLAEDAKMARMEEEQESRKEALRNTMLKTQDAERELPGAVKAAAQTERAATAALNKEESDKAAIAEERKEWKKKLKSATDDRSAYEPSPLDDYFPPWMIGKKDSPAGLSAVDERIEEARANLERLDKEEAVVQQKRKDTVKAAKPARTRADDLQKQIKTGRDESGRLWEDIEKGGRDIETYRWHRGKVNTWEKRTRGIESNSEAEGADRDDEEKKQREMERHGSRIEDSLGKGGASLPARLDIPNSGAFSNVARQVEGALQDYHESTMGVLSDLQHRIESHTAELANINSRILKNQQLG